jgi:hypothetical protein
LFEPIHIHSILSLFKERDAEEKALEEASLAQARSGGEYADLRRQREDEEFEAEFANLMSRKAQDEKSYRAWLEHKHKGYTIAEISLHTGIEPPKVVQAMKAAEDNFVHLPHPVHPDMTRYTLREHAHALEPHWQPGMGLSNGG